MIRITQQDSAKDAKRYYATADYYNEGQEIVGRWGGKGAALLGLEGTVDKASFERLCDNLHPMTGLPLTVRTRTERTVGYDFTFSVPKSVSLLYALSGDQGILDAFRGAVDETMREIESEMKTRVRKNREDCTRPTASRPCVRFQCDLGCVRETLESRSVPRVEAGCPVLPGCISRSAGWQAP